MRIKKRSRSITILLESLHFSLMQKCDHVKTCLSPLAICPRLTGPPWHKHCTERKNKRQHFFVAGPNSNVLQFITFLGTSDSSNNGNQQRVLFFLYWRTVTEYSGWTVLQTIKDTIDTR